MILDEICEHKRKELEETKANVSITKIHDLIANVGPPRDFRQAIREPGMSLISEVKHASPSKGLLVEDWEPVLYWEWGI